jgi:hypothetical protein
MKVKVVIAILLIFTAGLLAGALVSGMVLNKRFEKFAKEGRFPAAMVLNRLKWELDLTEKQQSEIEKILEDSHQKLADLRTKYKPEFETIFDNTHEKIKDRLNSDQKKMLEEKFRRIKDRFEPKPPPPPPFSHEEEPGMHDFKESLFPMEEKHGEPDFKERPFMQDGKRLNADSMEHPFPREDKRGSPDFNPPPFPDRRGRKPQPRKNVLTYNNIKDYLELTAEQEKEIRPIIEESLKSLDIIRSKYREKRFEMMEAFREEIETYRSSNEKRLEAFLSSEQLIKYKNIMDDRLVHEIPRRFQNNE